MKHIILCTLSAATLCTFLACGGAPDKKSEPVDATPAITGAETGPFKAQASLQWMPDGSWILVDGHLRFDPATGKFSPLNGTREGDLPILGPAGQRAYVGKDQLRVDGVATEIPTWLEGAKVEGNVGYWVDDTRIYVQQFGRDAATCRIFVIAEKAWRNPAAECMDVGQWQIESLRPGPGYLVHSYATNDGAPDVRILRYDPRQGQGETLLELQVGSMNPSVTFTPDGARALVVSSCEPGAVHGCGMTPSLTEYELYDDANTSFGFVAPGAVASPSDRGLAWIRNGALCLGAPRGPARCFAP